VLIGLVGLAFGGGIWFATTRRRPEPYRGPVVATPMLPVDYEHGNAYVPPAYVPPAYEPADDETANDGRPTTRRTTTTF
jgi:pimeloyl-ACP methyl ester carboxylesterase